MYRSLPEIIQVLKNEKQFCSDDACYQSNSNDHSGLCSMFSIRATFIIRTGNKPVPVFSFQFQVQDPISGKHSNDRKTKKSTNAKMKIQSCKIMYQVVEGWIHML